MFKRDETEIQTASVTRVSKEYAAEQTDECAVTIGGDERMALEAAGIEPAIVSQKDCSYRMLVDAGVDETIANDLRRQFSLPWSFDTETDGDGDGDSDLDQRSTAVRGLGEAERAWVAASADEDWQAFESVYSRATENESSEDLERPWPRPTPVTAVTGISSDKATHLADAGINSAERLATINAGAVASALGLNVLHVRTWRYNARELLESES